MAIEPYLFFNGCCEEAIYRRIDVGCGHIEVQGGDNEVGNFTLQSCVVSRRRRLSERRRFVGHIP